MSKKGEHKLIADDEEQGQIIESDNEESIDVQTDLRPIQYLINKS